MKFHCFVGFMILVIALFSSRGRCGCLRIDTVFRDHAHMSTTTPRPR